jgi:CheY-like chemotaxis protein
LNLLSNAIKYNRDGGRVFVECVSVSEERLRFRVLDTGPGIPPAFLDRLFQPFERVDSQTNVPGAGLGLALCKRLTELMGGSIGVETNVGEGSTFWLDLQVSASTAEHADSPTQLAHAPVRSYTRARGLLYVEDNLSNLELVESIVALRPSIRLISAMQGQMAIDLARQHGPDLILLDIHLPDMDGEEVLRRLQAEPRTQKIPVVMISADGTRRQMERLTAWGVRSYLTKPVNIKEFLRLLDELLA